jgi:metal-responsive CopG/Arc/MetJ family transcriptional regulator
MASKAVQVSLDTDLLKRVDRDPEARKVGRSAFVRAALELYLHVRERRAADYAIHRAYAADADEMLADAESLIEAQEWPKK